MSVNEEELTILRKKLFLGFLIPAISVFMMWFVKLTELAFETDFTGLGIYPLQLNGLPGIIFSPLIHSDFSHLISNSVPFLLLGTALFYFYAGPAVKIFTLNYFLTGILVWFTGRPAWHIGASGVVYGLMSFLFFSGIIRRYYRLTALSLLVVFLYGSMVWGMFPDVYRDISWEAHAMGFITGIFLAIIFRNEGPRRPVYDWMEDEETSDEYVNPESEKNKTET